MTERANGRTHRVFVYGSLLPGMANHGVAAPHVLSAVPGRVRGRLVDAGPYPALLWSPGEAGERGGTVAGCGNGGTRCGREARRGAGAGNAVREGAGKGAVKTAGAEAGETDADSAGKGAVSQPVVKGMWLTVTDAGLAAMDRLEEFFGVEEVNDYERVWVTDAEDASVAGWAYVWTDARGFPVVDADWWPGWLAGKRTRPCDRK